MGMHRIGSGASWRPFLLVAFLALMLAAAACERNPLKATPESSATDALDRLAQQLDRTAVERFIGQPIPASATAVHTAGEAALDTVVLARFTLPDAELQPYLASLAITELLKSGYSPFFTASAPLPAAGVWWKAPIAGASGAYRGLYQRVGSKNYLVVVTTAGGDLVTVYLQVHNT